MKIDWFTIAAQAVNFLVLVWLMRRFLYKPILNAIDEREKRIAAKLANAEKIQTDATKERDEFEQKNSEFDRQRDTLLRTATDEAQTERQKLIEQARNDARALQSQQRETLRNEQHSLRQAIGLRAQQEVFAITRKTLADLAGTSLEARVCDVFTGRVRQIDGTEKENFAEALATMSGPALVRSAFDLPDTQRLTIQNALNETFAADIELQFETAAGLIGGIEVSANGRKVAWSIEEYLTSLEQGVTDLLKENDKPEVSAETGTKNQ
jgi:F-type H+-transporting ATPase subunit b